MDDSRFDDLARTLTVLTPRRAMVRVLTAGTMAAFSAALVGLADRDDVEAGKGKKKKKKKNKKKKGAGPGPGPALECVTDNDCCPDSRPTCDTDDTTYGIFQKCDNGVCRCPQTVDNKPRYLCAPTGSSIASCRDCCDDAHCVADAFYNGRGRTYCYPGSRTCQCPDGMEECRVFGSSPVEYHCTDTDSDPTNCGGCGNAFLCNLALGETCTGGRCGNPGPP